ncbi:MAG: hypothetical protein Q8N77_00725, partial [Nanoarchaeota archaeon]|nr:hypothetical protein [Nanoarchaeota archaeon]
LADREDVFRPEGAKPFRSIIPLSEIIAEVLHVKQLNSKKVLETYNRLIEKFGSEMNVLLDASFEELKKVADEKIAKAIVELRDGKVDISPGFDGVYGKVRLGISDAKLSKLAGRQTSLGQF